MSLCKNLEVIIKREKCKMEYLAATSGISKVTINNVIKDRKVPKLDTVYYLFNAMGYDLYLVSPCGWKQKYESISNWLDFIMDNENLNIKGLADAFQCTDVSIYYYLRDDRSPSIYFIQSFANRFGYSIKLVKGDVEYDLFKPINIWQGVC